jgi:hypothetical protein
MAGKPVQKNAMTATQQVAMDVTQIVRLNAGSAAMAAQRILPTRVIQPVGMASSPETRRVTTATL